MSLLDWLQNAWWPKGSKDRLRGSDTTSPYRNVLTELDTRDPCHSKFTSHLFVCLDHRSAQTESRALQAALARTVPHTSMHGTTPIYLVSTIYIRNSHSHVLRMLCSSRGIEFLQTDGKHAPHWAQAHLHARFGFRKNIFCTCPDTSAQGQILVYLQVSVLQCGQHASTQHIPPILSFKQPEKPQSVQLKVWKLKLFKFYGTTTTLVFVLERTEQTFASSCLCVC